MREEAGGAEGLAARDWEWGGGGVVGMLGWVMGRAYVPATVWASLAQMCFRGRREVERTGRTARSARGERSERVVRSRMLEGRESKSLVEPLWTVEDAGNGGFQYPFPLSS